ncbi:MAG TPA: DUF2079 domain-containing protein [Chloroflexota bacterium]|nr:DUF2079 domain-containing protein [Chloroflexota bacterium]
MARARSVPAALVVNALLWAMTLAYAAFFVYVEWLRYHTFLMHALDMGNMEQAVWNTAHGQPFAFNNLRIKWGLEATGTTTRLSFHVEPILLLVAIPYLFVSSPVTLMVIQALVVASGVFPAAWLAWRYLGSRLAQIAFPLAYLLAPPLEAATLYEFHAVTLAAALLLWALYFADRARYGFFALCAILAAATKEEIGLVVAMMGLWIWWRHSGAPQGQSSGSGVSRGNGTVGLTTAILGLGWSLFCVFVVMRHFSHGHDSPYCARFNPYMINGRTADPAARVTSCVGVARIWLAHPDQVLSILVMPQKLGFLHRMLMPVGYLALLSPLTLAISLPSYAVILFSNDVHMYSGLGHYPAELVPFVIGAAIVGTAWLANQGSRVIGRPRGALRARAPGAITTAACVWLLVASVANQRVNGFTPLYEGFALPQVTYHDRVGYHILDMIPRHAAVAADDYLNDHLSDRRNIYLFPDIGDAQYAVVDVSRDNFPYSPGDEMSFIHTQMLDHGAWGVVYASDGYILMERRKPNPVHPTMAYNASFPATLPPSFYTFVVPPAAPRMVHPMTVDFGPSLQLVGYDVQRREQVNLRQPDVWLTTYWRLREPLTSPITPVVYLTNGAGAIDVLATDHPATDWLPTTRWPVAKVITLTTVPLTVFTNENGTIDVDLAVYQPGACPYDAQKQAVCDLLNDAAHRYRPNVRWTPGHVPLEVVAQGTILKLAQVTAHW